MLIRDEDKRETRFYSRVSREELKIDEAITKALIKVDQIMDMYGDGFVSPVTSENRYLHSANIGWTTGFWTGILWLSYELTMNPKYKQAAEKQVISFSDRLDQRVDLDHHDIGFLYSPSCVAANKITGDPGAREVALRAAQHLYDARYEQQAGIIRCWSGGKFDEDEYRFNMIIDSLMNMPLMEWAYEQTGHLEYRDAVQRHMTKAINHIIREDASTFHVYVFDEKGKPKFGETAQGYSHSSCWSRGQAWGIYGLAINYSYTKDEHILKVAERLAHYFLNRSPEDMVAYWDFEFTEGSGQLKDSSASAVAVCGLLELAKWVTNEEDKTYYRNAAEHIVKSLTENYASSPSSQDRCLLLHGVGSVPHDSGIDEGNVFGDYYYLESLVRLKKDWNCYW
ncbi:hypothetical protein B1748_25190 [Paenibacillus sp. MY03]|uniref:glycoside hydrolase family 88 protein n=1 Tax=Paenibacillus sp. MY03 TaxID=302980 RepID=UPI000B3C8C11|nr:glycoside hydrolase family 88 protein [Paenibacillus sp. MY03]OUS72155.1 hypothetical protein B1748_25190 [Paenibacillus sp. MY03]